MQRDDYYSHLKRLREQVKEGLEDTGRSKRWPDDMGEGEEIQDRRFRRKRGMRTGA